MSAVGLPDDGVTMVEHGLGDGLGVDVDHVLKVTDDGIGGLEAGAACVGLVVAQIGLDGGQCGGRSVELSSVMGHLLSEPLHVDVAVEGVDQLHEVVNLLEPDFAVHVVSSVLHADHA